MGNPNRRLWILVVALLLLALLERPLAGVARADFGVTAGVMAVVSIISSLFGLFRGKAQSNLIPALDGIRRGVMDLGKELVNLAARAFGAIWSALAVVRRFLMGFIRDLWDYVKGIWWHIREMLRVIFTPIIEFLKRIRDHIRRIYTRFVRPVLDVIEIVRRALGLLALFNIEWARELDRKLAELIQKINEPFTWVESKLTWLENWIYRIVTVDGLVQRIALIGATWRDINYLTTQWWARLHRPLTPAQRANYTLKPIHPNSERDYEELKAYLTRREGILEPKIREMQANIKFNVAVARRV